LFTLLAAVIAVVVVLVAYAVWRSPHRNDLATFWGFVATLLALAASGVAWAWRRRNKRFEGSPSSGELDGLADQLAEAVVHQWEDAGRARKLLHPEPIPVPWKAPSEAMAGPVAAAIGSTRFPRVPGMRSVAVKDLRGGDIRDLHAVYGGLRSGRLVIAGAPGSGKSGAAVLLILAALRHRQSVSKKVRSKVPVPVLFTLQGWNPSTQTVQDWLTRQFQQSYPFLAGKVGAAKVAGLLAAADKVAVVLDGLDEIPRELRPVALRALSDQTGFRVIVLTRSTEMTAAAQEGLLEGAAAIELQDVDPETAASYLTSVGGDPPPDDWREMIDRIRREPGGPLARALSSPLALTLVRYTYRSEDDVRELLTISDAADGGVSEKERADRIVDHLLGRVLPSAYIDRPGYPLPYDLETAKNALLHIAAQMHRTGIRDLEWWSINSWAPRIPRVITTAAVTGMVVGVVAMVATTVVAGLKTGLNVGLGVVPGAAMMAGMMVWIATGPEGYYPSGVAKWRLRHAWEPGILLAMPAGGLSTGLVVGLSNGARAGFEAGLLLALGLMAWMGLLLGLRDIDSTASLSPFTAWRSDRRAGLVYALITAVAAWLVGGIWVGLGAAGKQPMLWLVIVLMVGLGSGLFIGLLRSGTWSSSLVFIQLAWRWHTPIRLMPFLEDARERGVLRIVGPVYQFRHARLQDRLAEQASTSAPAQEPTGAPAV
jgi:hypothetical protein